MPLFRPGFLGDKWPAVDFYVELNGVQDKRPFFLIQVKSTTGMLSKRAKALRISSTRHDIIRLLQVPGPSVITGN